MVLTLLPTTQAGASQWRTTRIHRLVHQAQHLQRDLARPVSVYHGRTLQRTLHHWRWRVTRLDQAWTPWTPEWLHAALCVHRGEGAWNAISKSIPTYYGGLQMDASFAMTYGPAWWRRYGTPDHWPAHAQLVAAHHAWRVRGWTPWPLTAHFCGLI